ncbi:TPA: hypothetical protein N0F65_011794 [Lagenidium giganteum]|uniref:Uncharacterized protein n=1 Tax=Lagenidium giganteum TaxID=4803 RepID=A0AAV2YR43_9STRA|nr:TPA: hypothetical protein N0F65_011794 [Lagenidium giganteum]
MIELRQPNVSSVLRQSTPLRPVLSNVTRWSLTFAMIDRYLTICTHPNGIAAVEDLLLHGSSHRQLLELHRTRKTLDSVCQKRQAESATLACARILFDGCVERHPEMAEHLRPRARTVHSPVFESAVIRLIRDLPLGAIDLSPFNQAVSLQQDDGDGDDFAAGLLR